MHTKIISQADARTKNIKYDLDILSSYDPTKVVCIHDMMKLNLIQNTFIHFSFPVHRSLLGALSYNIGRYKKSIKWYQVFHEHKKIFDNSFLIFPLKGVAFKTSSINTCRFNTACG